MALFGLGNFAEGFVGGLAQSANKALIEEMDDIKDRVKTVSDYRVKRAVEENEERTEEFNDIRDALKQGADLFGDDPRSMEMAASLLKDQGNLAGYTALINKMRTQKQDSGINPVDFFARAEVDAPAAKGYTASDYARSFQGAPKTLPDYRLPEGMVSAGAGNLLSKIGLNPDISGQIQDRTSEQMAAMGVGVDTADLVAMPSIGFDSEEWNLADKDASAKIKYYNEKLVNPRLSEDTRAKYEEKLQMQLGIAAESKDDEIRVSALEQQLSRADAANKPAIQKQITEIKIQQKRREAEAAVADGSDIMAVNKLDKADAYRRSQDENLSEEEREKALQEFYRIGEVLTDYSKGEPTVADTFAKRREGHRRKQAEDLTYKVGNPEFDAEAAELKRLELISQDGSTKDATTTGITSSVKAIDLIISTNPTITANIPNNNAFQKIKKLVDNADTLSAGIDLLSVEKSANGGPSEREIYEQGMAAMRNAGQPIVDQYINALPVGKDRASAIAAAKLLGYDVSAYSASISTPSVDAGTGETDTAATATAATGDTAAETPSAPATEAQIKASVPDTVASANNVLDTLMRRGGNIKDAIADAKDRNYSPEFIAVLEAERDTDTIMTRAAMEPAVNPETIAAEEQAGAAADVESAIKIIDDTTGFASKEIRAIANKLGITREEATKLHSLAEAAIAERREQNKPTRKRRARGGLMERG